jgi:hypothetical protein
LQRRYVVHAELARRARDGRPRTPSDRGDRR